MTGSSKPPIPAGIRKVLVLGWYGTETIGDLAILSGIFDAYRQASPGVRFVVPSLNPAYTRHNVGRIGLECSVTSYGDPELIGDLWNCDTVIIGGGPLMDLPQMPWLASIFERGRLAGCRTIVEGCGVGPVNLPATGMALRRIMAAATDVRLRDRGSALLLGLIGINRHVDIVEDPARRWVQSTGIRYRRVPDGPICVFARELSWEYSLSSSGEMVTERLAQFLKNLCVWFPCREVRLHSMHHFPVGGDDRRYAHRLKGLINMPTCHVDDIPRTPIETVDIMADAAFAICMRFHSLVFADVVGTPLLAIDYTSGGKVADYADDHGLSERCVSFSGLARLDRRVMLSLGLQGEPGAEAQAS
jgi:polysaccharide pyruvyl transferase WcaK-like protein